VTAVDILMMIMFGALSRNWDFLSTENLQFLGFDSAETIILAVGLGMVLASGLIDLSVGAVLVLSSVVSAKVMLLTQSSSGPGLAILFGLAACLATGVIFGIVNGLIVIYLKVNAFIATLATLGIGTGVALVITSSGDLFGLPAPLERDFGAAKVAGVPLPLLVALVIAVIVWFIVTQTRFGLRALAMGSSRSAAERAGISRAGYTIAVLGLMGFLAGIVGFLDIARFGATNVGGHTTDALEAIAGAIIGGAGLYGGKVSVGGAVAGAVLSVILLSGLIVVGAAAAYQQIAIGAILVVAVSLDQFNRPDE
jgi:ribose transport system permease protein